MENSFCHIELNSNDPKKAKEFYKEMFTWEYEEHNMDVGEYTIIKTGKEPYGGIFKNPVPEYPSHWLVYILVENIEESTSKVEQLGGKVLKEITPVPGMGKFSVIQDPTDAVVALWQAEPASLK